MICPNCGTDVSGIQIPSEYKPLSPWAYFGYTLLFSIPVIGFIFLLIYTFNGQNINRRNFARSYWCALLLAVLAVVVLVVTGAGAALLTTLTLS